MQRDQSEDRVTKPLYIVVGFEHRVFGTVFYVQNPKGERSSIYARRAGTAAHWARMQEAEHPALIYEETANRMTELTPEQIGHPGAAFSAMSEEDYLAAQLEQPGQREYAFSGDETDFLD